MAERDAEIARQVADLLRGGCLILDLETTASSRVPEVAIVEIGLIDHRGQVLLDTLVRPHGPISAAATEIHGLTERDLAGAPSFDEVHPQLTTLLSGQAVVAYDAEAEQKVLEADCRRHGLPIPQPHTWHDAARLYAVYSRADRLLPLSEACEREGIPAAEAHRALPDCRLTLALLRKMAAAAEANS